MTGDAHGFQAAIDNAFLTALETTDPEERDRYLSGLSEDVRLEVGALLSAHAATDEGFLARTDGLSRDDTSVSEVVPARIGPYAIERRLGAGGMGVVYLAEQEDPVRRTVALKIIQSGLSGRQIVTRFEAERQALALMDHTGIARVLDAGVTEDGRPYFAMEYVDGLPITRFADEQTLGVRQRVTLFVEACRAIQHAHQKGILHRDVKPSNVLVAQAGDSVQVKVIDFGLAKAVHAETRLTDRSLGTHHGQVIGTPAYMSPEQAGDSVRTDTRSDVFSLGVLLYELLAGSTPVPREVISAEPLPRVLRRICEDRVERPSIRLQGASDAAELAARRGTTLSDLTADLAGDLDWVVLKAVEQTCERRYASADALADDCVRFLESRPVEARPPSFGYQLSRLYRRHRVAFAVSALALVLVCGALGVSSWLAWRNHRLRTAAMTAKWESDRLREAAVDARKESDRAVRRTVQALATILNRVDGIEYREDPAYDAIRQQVQSDVYTEVAGLRTEVTSRNNRLRLAELLLRLSGWAGLEWSNATPGAERDESPTLWTSQFANAGDALAMTIELLEPLPVDDPVAASRRLMAFTTLARVCRTRGAATDAQSAIAQAGDIFDASEDRMMRTHPMQALLFLYEDAAVTYPTSRVESHHKARRMLAACRQAVEDHPGQTGLLLLRARCLSLLGLTMHKSYRDSPILLGAYGYPSEVTILGKPVEGRLNAALELYEEGIRTLEPLRHDARYAVEARRELGTLRSNMGMSLTQLTADVPETRDRTDRSFREGVQLSRELLELSPGNIDRKHGLALILGNYADFLYTQNEPSGCALREEALEVLSGFVSQQPPESRYGGLYCLIGTRVGRDRLEAGDRAGALTALRFVLDYSGELAEQMAPYAATVGYALLRDEAVTAGQPDAVARWRQKISNTIKYLFPKHHGRKLLDTGLFEFEWDAQLREFFTDPALESG